MTENLPTGQDKLFKEEKDLRTGARIGNKTNKFYLYSEGYKEAARILYKFCQENPFYNQSIIYPLVFNYRQFIELRVKELIIMGYKYLDDSEGDFPDEHNLLKLWNIYRNKILPNIDRNIESEMLNNVERIICEFSAEDPKSMSFRYPVTRRPDRKPSLNRVSIDLENFRNVIEKVIYFFDWQWEMISYYEDFKQEMMADMYRNYWR